MKLKHRCIILFLQSFGVIFLKMDGFWWFLKYWIPQGPPSASCFFPPTILIAMFEIIYIENPFRTRYFYLRPIVVPELRMDTLHNPEAKLRCSVVFRAACGGLSKYEATFDNVRNQKHVEEIPRALSARYTCKMENVDVIPAWTLLNLLWESSCGAAVISRCKYYTPED